jgi:hypothetical protein
VPHVVGGGLGGVELRADKPHRRAGCRLHSLRPGPPSHV